MDVIRVVLILAGLAVIPLAVGVLLWTVLVGLALGGN